MIYIPNIKPTVSIHQIQYHLGVKILQDAIFALARQHFSFTRILCKIYVRLMAVDVLNSRVKSSNPCRHDSR